MPVAIVQVGFRGPPGAPGGGITWATLSGKPSTFQPSPHPHAIDDVVGLPEALAAAGGSPTWDAVTGKPTAFPPVAHQHPWSEITGKPTTFAPITEDVQDIVGALIVPGNGMAVTYGDVANSLTIGLSDEIYTAPEKAKLTGIASGATANATDAALRDRSSHTGVQGISTIDGLQTALDGKASTSTIWTLEQIQDAVAAMFQGGTHTLMTVVYDDPAGTISLASLGGGGGGGLTVEEVQDIVGALIVPANGLSAVYNDAGNTLTISLAGESYTTVEKTKLSGIATGATANSTDAALRDRTSHTGTQAISTITGLQAALDAKAALAHTHPWSDLTGVPGTFQPVAHGHAPSEITGLQALLDAKLAASLASAFALTVLDDADATAMRTTLGLGALATLSTVANANITNATITDAKLVNMPAATIKGNAAGSAASPANLTVAQVKTMLALSTADISGLTAALAGKSNTAHTHAWADITGKPTTFAPDAHGHAISDTTGLQAALDGKVTNEGGVGGMRRVTQAFYDGLVTNNTVSETTAYYIVG